MLLGSISSLLSSIPAWGWFDIIFTLMVLGGICGESPWLGDILISEKPNDIIPIESKRKKLKKWSEIALIVGIAGETVCLAFSLWESAKLNKDAADARLEVARLEAQITQTSNNVVRIDPQNAKISDIGAFVVLCVKGRGFGDDLPHWGSPWVAQILLCKNNLTTSGFDVLSADSFSTSIDMIGDDRLYKIRLHAENVNEASGFETPVQEINGVNLLRIDVKFLTNRSEIINGAVELIVNNNIRKQFQILPRIDTNPFVGTPGIPYTIVATNVP
jgi:hypothetical protein